MRRSAFTAVLLLPAALLLSGAPAAAQLEIGEAEVLLLDAGEEPRQLLRYELTEGSSDVLRIDTDMTMTMAIDGVDMMSFEMPISMTTTSTVTDVHDDGSARVEYVISEWDFGDMGGLMSEGEEAELEAALELMEGIGGWMVIDTRGALLDYGAVLPEGIPEEMLEQSEQVATEVELLPEEPVGLGAIWESAMTTSGGGMEMAMISTSKIVHMDDEVIVLEQGFESDITPDFGGLDLFGELLGDSFMETELTGSGSSDLRLDRISQPAQMELLVAMTMGIDDGERITEIAYDMGMDVVATLVD